MYCVTNSYVRTHKEFNNSVERVSTSDTDKYIDDFSDTSDDNHDKKRQQYLKYQINVLHVLLQTKICILRPFEAS